MTKPGSLQAILAEWEKLLTELQAMPYDLPQVDSCRIALEKVVRKTRAVKARQVACRIAAQRATRQLNEALKQGKDMVSRTRSILRGCLGIHNEELVRFGVAPIRKRGRRRAAALN